MRPIKWLLAALTLACAFAAALPGHADPQAVALLQKVQAASQSAKTLTAEMTYTTKYPGEPATGAGDRYLLRLMKPNFASIIKITTLKETVPEVVASDGTSIWSGSLGDTAYQKAPTLPDGRNIQILDTLIVQAFFAAPEAVQDWIYIDDLNDLTSAGTEVIGGVKYRVLKHHMMGTLRGEGCPFLQRLYIGPDNLIHRYRLDFKYQGRPGVEMADLKNVRLGAALAPSDFAFTPPPAVQEVTPPPSSSGGAN